MPDEFTVCRAQAALRIVQPRLQTFCRFAEGAHLRRSHCAVSTDGRSLQGGLPLRGFSTPTQLKKVGDRDPPNAGSVAPIIGLSAYAIWLAACGRGSGVCHCDPERGNDCRLPKRKVATTSDKLFA